jgi:hypothetical protein
MRSKESRDHTRRYGVGNHLCGVAREILLAAIRDALFVRRHGRENAVGQLSNAQELGRFVRLSPSSESNCTRISGAEIRVCRRPLAPTVPLSGCARTFLDYRSRAGRRIVRHTSNAAACRRPSNREIQSEQLLVAGAIRLCFSSRALGASPHRGVLVSGRLTKERAGVTRCS